MKYGYFLIKYGEIGLKGKNKHFFENTLIKRMLESLSVIGGKFNINKEFGRIYVESCDDQDDEDVIEALKRVFGIVAICPTVRLYDKDNEAIKNAVVDYVRKEYSEGAYTFKVETRRADKNYPGTSETISAMLGEVIIENCDNLRVDVKNPDVIIKVEIREQINIYSKSIEGAYGMPVGTNGRALVLLSGGIDSPVAAYMIAKRGVGIDAVYFHASPYTSERAKQKVIDLAKIVSKYSGSINLHIINFTDIELYIYEKCPHEELTVIMRRYMVKIAQKVAKEIKAHAMITGESIGQVASQTMKSLVCTDAVAQMPIFRPLIGFDKHEIIDIAQKIGTFETSILPYEDCCTIFVAKHPVTKPNIKAIEKSERLLDEKIDEMIETAVNTREIIIC